MSGKEMDHFYKEKVGKKAGGGERVIFPLGTTSSNVQYLSQPIFLH